ncbi:hypothetical protein BDZ85DRAFT_213351, partial [Elsinoe ampelina]
MSDSRGRSPPYPVSPLATGPNSKDLPAPPRDRSTELSISDASTPLQSHSPIQSTASRDGSLVNDKQRSNVTVQPVEQAQPLTRWQRTRYWANRNWAYEVAACCISAITLAGVVILLWTRQNKPLPDWPALITLNSLIAVLTTIMKGCMIFAVAEGISQLKWSWFLRPRSLADLSTYDSASRGPWGSLLFLFSGKLDAIATIGATITLIALAIDPFAQQVFLFEPCMQPQNDSSVSIPRVQVFAPVMDGDRLGTGSNQLEILNGMLRASYSAMIEPSAHLPARLDPVCRSGNCTWNATDGYYQTLTISHACMDVTSFISNLTTDQSNTRSWNYSLHSAPPYARAGNLTLDYNTILNMQVYQGSTGVEPTQPTSDIYRADKYTMFALAALFWKQVGSYNAIEDRRIVQPMAVTCKMWPTLKTYNAYIESGNLIETEIQTRDVSSWEKLDRHLIDGTWHNCTGTPSPTATNTIGLRNGTTILTSHDLGIIANNLAPLNVSYWSPSCTVQMGPMIFSQYREFLANMFTVKVPGRADTPQQGVMGSMRTQNQTVGNQMHLAAFLNEGRADLESVTRYMQALSGSLSAHMRTTANVTEPANRAAVGTAQVVRTCARVRWGWMALPAALTVATV